MFKIWCQTALFVGSLVVMGCGEKPGNVTEDKKKERSVTKTETKPENDEDHGWWCVEHGVKEEECSICQKEVYKKLKEDEICPNHRDRAKSQCFICQPELWEKNKAVYVAKFGSEPPAPSKNMPGKK